MLAVAFQSYDAFLLTRQWRDTDSGVLLDLWFASNDGPIQIEMTQQEVVFFIRVEEATRLETYIRQRKCRLGDVRLLNCHSEIVMPIYVRSQHGMRAMVDNLARQGVTVWEDDIRPPERFLMERFITGGAILSGCFEQKEKSIFCQNPQLKPAEYKPRLRCLSIDIETTMTAKQLYSIAAYSANCQVVFMIGEPTAHQENYKVVWCKDERDCLNQFFQWLNNYDPDVIFGWSFIQFDLWVLETICRKYKVKLDIGRGGGAVYWRQDRDSRKRYIQIPGRIALDGIDLLKNAAYIFTSYSLQNVSKELLGDGKLIQSNDRGEEITRLFEQEKISLARYNLQDCKLVWDIFEKLDLLNFSIERSQLTGLLMDKMGGSVAAFEFSYLPQLHRKGYVAPNLGELQSEIQSPGGYVLESNPGIYRNVLVLDFKSLYPSIIRTFCIDPYGFWFAQHRSSPTLTVPGFYEASFSRDEHILPSIIARLWHARDKAKKNNHDTLSYAIKIIMNSFYGVLGSSGCRFYDPRVCSSITLRGHEILNTTKDWIENLGYEVIYGDTDSVFVWVGDTCKEKQAQTIGKELAGQLNARWQQELEERYSISSALELEFETHYLQFLMPTVRNSSQGSKKRYAGIVKQNDESKLVFKGLENVRTDWTVLAKSFQKELYHRVFNNLPVEAYIREVRQKVLAGKLDSELLYNKRLRRSLDEYQKNVPPHVRAARKQQEWSGEQLSRGDWVEYLITVNGPEPRVERRSAIDYEHYIEKQLKPVADGVLQFVDLSFAKITQQQMTLF